MNELTKEQHGQIEVLRKLAFDMPPAFQYRLACFVAENVGYVLGPDPLRGGPDEARDHAPTPTKPDHRIYFSCECCAEHEPDSSCWSREDIGVMPDGTWLCDNCYSDCDKAAYGMVAHDIDDFEYPRFENLPQPSLYAVEAPPSTASSDGPVAAALLAVHDDKLAMYADIRQHGGLTECGEHGELVVRGLRAAMGCVADRYVTATPTPSDAMAERLRTADGAVVVGELNIKIKPDGDGFLICHGRHHTSEPCEFQAFTRALDHATPPQAVDAERERIKDAVARFHRNSCYPDAMSGELDACADAILATRRSPEPAVVEALEYIVDVCALNATAACDHKMALQFVAKVAGGALSRNNHEGSQS
jgi:hypothetical protein